MQFKTWQSNRPAYWWAKVEELPLACQEHLSVPVTTVQVSSLVILPALRTQVTTTWWVYFLFQPLYITSITWNKVLGSTGAVQSTTNKLTHISPWLGLQIPTAIWPWHHREHIDTGVMIQTYYSPQTPFLRGRGHHGEWALVLSGIWRMHHEAPEKVAQNSS